MCVRVSVRVPAGAGVVGGLGEDAMGVCPQLGAPGCLSLLETQGYQFLIREHML